MSHGTVRLWRVRKDHTWIDAQVSTGPRGVDVHFFLNGERVFSRPFSTRARDCRRRAPFARPPACGVDDTLVVW